MHRIPFAQIKFFTGLLQDVAWHCATPHGHSSHIVRVDLVLQGKFMQYNVRSLLNTVQAYMIGIVWSAYQYTIIRNAMCVRYELGLMPSTARPKLDDRKIIDFVRYWALGERCNQLQNLLPPDYDAATKLPEMVPPPRYEEELAASGEGNEQQRNVETA